MSGEMKDYGAIRRLYTPRNGTRVTSVSQIQDGSTLVVSKTNKFRKLQYASIMNIRERETQYNDFDIILDHFSRISHIFPSHATRHA